MLLASHWLFDVAIALVIAIYFLHRRFSKHYKYWEKRGIFFFAPLPFVGNFKNVIIMKTAIHDWILNQYMSVDEKLDFYGIYIFDQPNFVVRNPKLFKQFLIKDFDHFADRSVASPHGNIAQHMLFFQKNPEWKNDRNKISVAYTSGKLKKMLHLMKLSMRDFQNYLEENPAELDAKQMAANYSIDVVSRCAFGIASNSFKKDSTFKSYGSKAFGNSWRNLFSQTCYLFLPNLANCMNLNWIGQDAMNYFCGVFKNTYESQRDCDRYEDLIDIIKDIKRKEGASCNQADQKVCGIAMQLFFASFETMSSSIGFTLYEFAMNFDVQEKAREEVNTCIEKYGGVTYEAIQEMHYLEMCINETFRRYPVVPVLNRVCTKDYTISGTNVIIEKGMTILFPIYGVQMDEKYFSEPFKYNPERFTSKSINSDRLIFIPFGEGPRNCIGERFGKLGTKLALASILNKFKVVPCEKTPKIVEFEKKCILLQSTTGLPVKFKKLPTVQL